jgi:hypothetical protein
MIGITIYVLMFIAKQNSSLTNACSSSMTTLMAKKRPFPPNNFFKANFDALNEKCLLSMDAATTTKSYNLKSGDMSKEPFAENEIKTISSITSKKWVSLVFLCNACCVDHKIKNYISTSKQERNQTPSRGASRFTDKEVFNFK